MKSPENMYDEDDLLPLSGEEIRDVLLALGLSPTVRGEALSVADWIRLANGCKERL